jgi:predicted transposase/invertase (TIGR01784 family)
VFDVTQSSGYQKGKLEGKLEIAKALITFGELSLDKIAQATGLTLEQIKALEQEVKKEKKEKK